MGDNMNACKERTLLLIGLMAFSLSLQAEVKLPALISDNMLLQADKSVPIWGTADPGEKVTISFDGQIQSATADADGRWEVRLNPLKANRCGAMTVAAKNTISINNVLVGSVWICSGQSNMEMRIGAVSNATMEIAKAKFPKIRLFNVKRATALLPQTDVEGHWVECSPESLPAQGVGFSAAAYYFGRDIHLATGLPVGLIEAAWGGTTAEAWTSLSGLGKDPDLDAHVQRYHYLLTHMPELSAKYEQMLAEYPAKYKAWQEGNKPYAEALKNWFAEAAEARVAGKPAPPRPSPNSPEPQVGYAPDKNPGNPASLYNGMIAPLVPYAIEGVIWYQGESHSGRPLGYRKLFPALISDWRQQWGLGDFPYYYCQVANFLPKQENPGESLWAELREAQRLALRLPNTGMAVLIDIGETADVHPANKQEVGSRLARIALAKHYGKGGCFTGPVYRSMNVEGEKIRLNFDPIGGELMAKELPATYDVSTRRNETRPLVRNRPGSQLEGFAICGADRKWVWADARIDGRTVLVSAPEVKQPVAVRYAWADNPTCNLYNKEGLPAGPFRTDDITASPSAETPSKKP